MIAVGCFDNAGITGLSAAVKQPVIEFGYHCAAGYIRIQSAVFFGAGIIAELLGQCRKGFFCFVAGFPGIIDLIGHFESGSSSVFIRSGGIGFIRSRGKKNMTDIFGYRFITVSGFGNHQHRIGIGIFNDRSITGLAGFIKKPFAGIGGNFIGIFLIGTLFYLCFNGFFQFLFR